MKITVMKPNSGKTKHLIEESEKTGIPILTTTALRARNLRIKAYELGYVIPIPLSIFDLVSRNGIDLGVRAVLVDDFENVFESLINAEYGLEVAEITTSIGASST